MVRIKRFYNWKPLRVEKTFIILILQMRKSCESQEIKVESPGIIKLLINRLLHCWLLTFVSRIWLLNIWHKTSRHNTIVLTNILWVIIVLSLFLISFSVLLIFYSLFQFLVFLLIFVLSMKYKPIDGKGAQQNCLLFSDMTQMSSALIRLNWSDGQKKITFQ